MRARLELRGISASGRHGANAGERDEPQPFEIDLDVEVDVGPDELGGTADYRSVISAARETVERESFELLESLTLAVARTVLGLDAVEAVTATVHKPAAARSSDARDVAATIALSRVDR